MEIQTNNEFTKYERWRSTENVRKILGKKIAIAEKQECSFEEALQSALRGKDLIDSVCR
ncbi:MAG: hypothetical protein L6Q54_11755 [Leptospiraceae bacterium]|nr:hypothetical protein [Leptospiraceae bacterium]